MSTSLDEITVISTRPTAARQPRGIVRIGSNVGSSQAVVGWTTWTATNNSFYEADTFSLTFAASALPKENDANWFSNQTETFVEILGGFPADPTNPVASELKSFIYGRIDDMDFDPYQQTLTITGRDLTGAFIDAKITKDYANQTASQIANTLAASHGLDTDITSTSTKAGTYFQQDTMELQIGSEWDLLTKLAQREGFVVYVTSVDGTPTLYFGEDQTGNGSTLSINWQNAPNAGGSPIANVTSIGFSRSQTVVKGISVTVMSAGVKGPTIKKSYPYASRGTAPGKSSPYGPTTNYFKVIPPGCTALQAQAQAEAIYKEIASHAMKVKFSMPADTSTSPTSTVTVSGTGTAFDQTYYPRVVTRTMSVDEGFSMDVEAQNNSPNLTLVQAP